VICEDCGHLLGRAPDWSSIRGKRASHARQFALALVVVVGMLWLNVLAFGAAGFLIWMAPVFWLFMSGYRYRALSKSLKRSSVRAPALDPGTR
jgi:nitrate reductase NapE component